MWEIVERMKELNIPQTPKLALVWIGLIRAQNLEMVVQYMGEMVTLGLVPGVQTAQGAGHSGHEARPS